MDVPNVQTVRPQALQAFLEVAHGSVVSPGMGLRRQEDLLAPVPEDQAKALFADDLALSIVVGRVPVIKSMVEGLSQDLDAFTGVLDRAETAARADADERDRDPRLSENAGGKGPWRYKALSLPKENPGRKAS